MAQHLESDGAKATSREGSHAAAKSPSSRTVAKPGAAKRRAIVAGIVALALAIAYAAGLKHYETHFVPGATVSGVDAGGLTVEELAALGTARVASYTDHIQGDGLDFTLEAEDMGLTMDADTWASDALKMVNNQWWFLGPLAQQHVEPDEGIRLDEELLTEAVAAQVEAFNETAEPPTDSVPAIDLETGLFAPTQEALGTKVSVEAIAEAVKTDALALRVTTTLGEAQLARPAVTSTDEQLLAAIESANAMLSKSHTLTLDGKALPIEPVGAELMRDWIVFADTDEGEVATVDTDKVWRWCFDNLNDVVNGENETRSWEVDSVVTSQIIADSMLTGDEGNLEVATLTTEIRPDESEGHETRGRHIDVNLSTQYARLYDTDGRTVLWRSYIVSGDVSWGHDTPTGEFHINEKSQGVTLSGLNNGVVLEEGQEAQPGDYYVSYVDYWMCFLGSDYGLHDASWRSEDEFGGDRYLWDGSHGCVNLPVSKAAELYNLVEVGDTVYIHY